MGTESDPDDTALGELRVRRREFLYTFGGRSLVPAGEAARALEAADWALRRGSASDVADAIAALSRLSSDALIRAGGFGSGRVSSGSASAPTRTGESRGSES